MYLFRPVCRTIDEAQSPLYIAQNRYAKAFGFHNADEFVAALRDFVAAHTWAFQSYAKALLALTGGPDYMNTPPKQLWVRLKCLCTQGSSRDPARTFAFLGAHWQTVEEYLRTATGKLNWQKSAAMRTEVQRRNSDAPRYAGELPMLFAVENIDLWHGALYSQYYPDPHGANVLQGPDGLSTEIRRVICGDVLTLCASSIHLGLALRCAEGQASVAALPGRFVRTELKRWIWEPLFMDWDQYLAGPRGIQEVDYWLGNDNNSGLPIPLLLQYVRVLL